MFEKFIIIYSFIITLNSAVKLNDRADSNKSYTSLKKSSNAVNEAEDTWQPISQTRYWLPKPTTFTTALASSTEPLQQPPLKIELSNNAQEINFKSKNFTANVQQSYQAPHNESSKATVNLTTQPIPAATTSPSATLENMKIGSNLYSLNKQYNYRKIKANENYLLGSQQQTHLNLNYKETENQYPQYQISKVLVQHENEDKRKLPPLPRPAFSTKLPMLSQFNNLTYLRDNAEHKQLSNPSSFLLSYWHRAPLATNRTRYQTDNKNTSNSMNLLGKMVAANDNSTFKVLPTTFYSLPTNEHLNDNGISNIKSHQYHQFNSNSKKNGIRTLPADNKQAQMAANGNEYYVSEGNVVTTFLNSSHNFDDLITNKILSENYETTGSKKSYKDDNKHKSNMILSAVSTNNDFEPEMFLSPVQQIIKATSKTLLAALSATFGEEDLQLYLPSSAATLSSSYLHVENQTQNEAEEIKIQATPTSGRPTTAQLQNLPIKYKITSTVATLTTTPTFPSIIAPTSKSSLAVSSGRKLKKVKKRFQKLLLPLLLAYKLKFFALIPLLAGGLILLVGSTGLAGFFFALFTAVMSLKTDHGNAIVVKKY